ncbi:DMT family transporter [Thermodesulfobacteriota bacterium]
MIVYLLIAVIAICWGAGAAMQKQGMASEFPRLSLGTLVKDFRKILGALVANKAWVGGMLVMGAGGGVFAYTTSIGDISVIQPLTNVSGVVAVLVGVLVLKERLRGMELVGIVLLIGGAMTIGFSTETMTSTVFNEGMLKGMTVVTAAVIAVAFALFGIFGKSGGERGGLVMAFTAGVTFGLTNLFVKVVTEASKGGGEVMRVDGAAILDLLTSYPLYILLVALVLGMVAFQLACANSRIAVVQPVTTVFSNVLPVAGGWLVFGESMNAGKLAGTAIILAGTVLLAAGEPAGEVP